MYQDKILKLIIEKRDFRGGDYLERVSGKIFDDGHRKLYRIIADYHLRFGEVPDKEYIKEYFAISRDLDAHAVFNGIETVAVSDIDIVLAYVDLQVKYVLRQSMSSLLFRYDEHIKTVEAGKLWDSVREVGVESANLIRSLESTHKQELLLYGEEAKQQLLKDLDSHELYLCNYGIEQWDTALGGVYKDDLITIAAYTGGGKSTMLRQLAYNMALQGMNIIFITLEMKAATVMSHFLTLHANNREVFGYDKPRITYKKIRDKLWSDKEREFYVNEVSEDFFRNEKYGTVKIIQPQERYGINELFGDVLYADRSIYDHVDVVVVDYLTLVRPVSKKEPTREDYNGMLTDFRRFCLDNGIVGINAAQINRKGYDSAVKHKENYYDLSVLSDYNSLERDATNVFSLFQSHDMESLGEVQVQHLKCRESRLCNRFKLYRDGETGWHYGLRKDDMSAAEAAEILQSIEI
jgi:replicative DNA helicase